MKRAKRSEASQYIQYKDMEKYKCVVCGYIYDPAEGDPESGIEPGVPFSELPDDYLCPVCGAGKDEFVPLD